MNELMLHNNLLNDYNDDVTEYFELILRHRITSDDPSNIKETLNSMKLFRAVHLKRWEMLLDNLERGTQSFHKEVNIIKRKIWSDLDYIIFKMEVAEKPRVMWLSSSEDDNTDEEEEVQAITM